MMDPPDRDDASSEPDRAIEERILKLLAQRGPSKTICPSEVARALVRDPDPWTLSDDTTAEGWRALMDPVRRAAGRLVASGEVVVMQRGEVVDLTTAKGPIRLGRRDEWLRTE